MRRTQIQRKTVRRPMRPEPLVQLPSRPAGDTSEAADLVARIDAAVAAHEAG